MNDLRSRNRALAAVPDEGSAPTSTPPRVRPETEERSGRRMSRRQSIAERARRLEAQTGEGVDLEAGDAAASGHRDNGAAEDEQIILADDGTATVVGDGSSDDHMFRSSRAGTDSREATAAADEQATARSEAEDGPSSRPTKRRDMSDEESVPEEEDKFPWHFQFDDDEPEELQASSPLLSRAFRASIG